MALCAFLAAPGVIPAEDGAPRPAVVAYVFPQDARLDVAAVPAARITHVNYAFANIRDGRVVEGFAHDRENFRTLAALRRTYPHLKLLVSVGGWTWSGGFSDAALTARSRRRFVDSMVDLVARHDLDGADVDWEYPGLPGYGNVHRPEDKQNFTALMRELRAGLDARGRRTGRSYLLTLAAGASSDFLAHTEMDRVAEVADLVNLMTYDFLVPPGDGRSGHHANLYASAADPEGQTADRAVRAFLAAGVPAAKLVLGVPFYGRAWTIAEGEGPYAPGTAPRERIEASHAALASALAQGTFVRRFDAEAQAPYLWDAGRRLFVSWDDPESLAIKAAYVRRQGLRGMMFWELGDDPTGALLGAIHCGLLAPSVPECGALERERP
ncbi:MAG TPA: glycoside hydrolase family 18 protein [Vicinamibacteria bacterium]|nr:glycoside hydrolase family 18 protein [Vicinamibacteria bacterium]